MRSNYHIFSSLFPAPFFSIHPPLRLSNLPTALFAMCHASFFLSVLPHAIGYRHSCCRCWSPSCCRHRSAPPATLPLGLAHATLFPTRLDPRALTPDLAVHQIRRTADAAFEANNSSRRHRERGYGSSSRARSRSPQRPTSSRKRRRSRSPKHEPVSPSDRLEKRARDGNQGARRDNPGFFRSGAGPRGGACAVCLGRHEHTFSKCDGVKLWDGSAGSARKNEQGRLVAADGRPLCFDWQMPRGCSSTNHPDRHRCSGCGKTGHGAQSCSRTERA